MSPSVMYAWTYDSKQCICSHKQFTTSPTCNSPITFIHQTHMHIRLMQGCTMHLYMIPKCMRYHSPTRLSPRCNKHIGCKISHPSYIMDIKFVTISHVCMSIWLVTMHMFIQTIHHIITIHLAYMQSPTKLLSLSIYAFTDNITINQHICIHQQYHNQSTCMYSPTTSQSINNIILFLTIQIKEKIHHIKINIIFDT